MKALPLAVVNRCPTEHNFDSWEGFVQVVNGEGFFICSTSDHEYDDFLRSSEENNLKNEKSNKQVSALWREYPHKENLDQETSYLHLFETH